MGFEEYNRILQEQFSYLLAFARQINELDVAGSIFQEFRGMQDAGWSTTITAHEVFGEMLAFNDLGRPLERSELRVLLSLYAQLSEAGGVYEGLKNLIGVIKLSPYRLWPFQDLVRVRADPRRVIGPNANATFRNLARTARDVGMIRLSELLEIAFRDDIRNGISHADYIIWDDGLRLRNRNGGNAKCISYDEIFEAINRGVGFFQILKNCFEEIVIHFNPAREIVGKFSDNPPMRHRVEYNAENGSFSISCSSPGPERSPEYERQERINSKLGGKVISLYSSNWSNDEQEIAEYIESLGFGPHTLLMSPDRFQELLREIEEHELWDQRIERCEPSSVLYASPWGFTWLHENHEFDCLIPREIEVECA